MSNLSLPGHFIPYTNQPKTTTKYLINNNSFNLKNKEEYPIKNVNIIESNKNDFAMKKSCIAKSNSDVHPIQKNDINMPIYPYQEQEAANNKAIYLQERKDTMPKKKFKIINDKNESNIARVLQKLLNHHKISSSLPNPQKEEEEKEKACSSNQKLESIHSLDKKTKKKRKRKRKKSKFVDIEPIIDGTIQFIVPPDKRVRTEDNFPSSHNFVREVNQPIHCSSEVRPVDDDNNDITQVSENNNTIKYMNPPSIKSKISDNKTLEKGKCDDVSHIQKAIPLGTAKLHVKSRNAVSINNKRILPSLNSTGTTTQSLIQNRFHRGTCYRQPSPVPSLPFSLSDLSVQNISPSQSKNIDRILNSSPVSSEPPVITISSSDSSDDSSTDSSPEKLSHTKHIDIKNKEKSYPSKNQPSENTCVETLKIYCKSHPPQKDKFLEGKKQFQETYRSCPENMSLSKNNKLILESDLRESKPSPNKSTDNFKMMRFNSQETIDCWDKRTENDSLNLSKEISQELNGLSSNVLLEDLHNQLIMRNISENEDDAQKFQEPIDIQKAVKNIEQNNEDEKCDLEQEVMSVKISETTSSVISNLTFYTCLSTTYMTQDITSYDTSTESSNKVVSQNHHSSSLQDISFSQSSEEYLNEDSKKCLTQVIQIMSEHYNVPLKDCVKCLEKNMFNILTTMQELQLFDLSSQDTFVPTNEEMV